MNYKATIITETIKIEFGSKTKELLLKRVLRTIKKINQEQTITLSTRLKSYLEGHECYTPCYPCEFISEDFTKDELVEKLEDYLNRASALR